MEGCIFCKIIKGELPADIVYRDEKVVVFQDIHPRAPVHFLLVPREHLESIKDEHSEDYAQELIKVAKNIAQDKNLSAYKLVFNVGREAGQTVNHLHLHLLALGPSELTI